MKFSSVCIKIALMTAMSSAFTTSPTRTTHLIHKSKSSSSFSSSLITTKMGLLDNLFNSDSTTSVLTRPQPPSNPPPLTQDDPEALFAKAKTILSSDFGIRDPSLLSDDFIWIGPNVVTTGPLNKNEYLAAGSFFDLRSAFPDLDYRSHDFRIVPDDDEPLTIRFTARTVGTMRGELRLRSETLFPNGKRMVCPPEAITMTFDSTTGKLTKLCSGFPMDRLVGNTAGLCGVMAAATVAGAPPSEWEIYPPAAVIGRFFGRTVKQLDEAENFLAPFPESVMIQLAKGVLSAENGLNDPDLLSDDFTYSTLYYGPYDKKGYLDFLAKYNVRESVLDYEEGYTNFRVDPYDPYRVWIDMRSSGTISKPFIGMEPSGKTFVGPPEALSLTFDDNGFCTRITSDAVMDPTNCNTGGLPGVQGILYANGTPEVPLLSRPLPQILARARKGLLSPILKTSVDELTPAKSSSPVADKSSSSVVSSTTPAEAIISEDDEQPTIEKPKLNPIAKLNLQTPPSIPSPPKVVAEKSTPKAVTPTIPIVKPAAAPKPPKAPKAPVISDDPADPVTDAFAMFFGTRQKKPETATTTSAAKAKANTIPTADKKKAEIDSAMAAAADAKRKARMEAAAKIKAQAEEAARKKAELEEIARAKAEAAAAKKAELEAMARKNAEAMAALKVKKVMDAKKQAEVDAAAKADAAAKKQAEADAAAKAKADLMAQKKAEREAAAQARAEAAERRKAEREAAAQARAEAAEKRKAELKAKADAAAAEKKARMEAAAKAKAEALAQVKAKQSEQAQQVNAASLPRGTISLASFFGIKSISTAPVEKATPAPKAEQKAAPPKDVPVIYDWKRNWNGSVSGFISGSSNFEEGELVTTSRIAQGKFESGSVVTTTSGSQYFLR